MIFYNIKNNAFTLVELVIVIMIISILATIGFISFQGYTSQARDSVRVTDIINIEKALIFDNIQGSDFPKPELIDSNLVELEGITGIKWYKGKFGEEQFKKISKLDKLPIDPKNKTKYDYYVTEDYKFYRLETDRELLSKFIRTNYKSYTLNDRLWSRNETEICNRDSAGRFVLNGDIIIDNATGSMWELNHNKTKLNWNQAKSYCASLVKGGYNDWRLPDITEFRSIINYSCYKTATYNPFKLEGRRYWSSTTYSPDINLAWFSDLYYGDTYWGQKNTSSDIKVICIR